MMGSRSAAAEAPRVWLLGPGAFGDIELPRREVRRHRSLAALDHQRLDDQRGERIVLARGLTGLVVGVLPVIAPIDVDRSARADDGEDERALRYPRPRARRRDESLIRPRARHGRRGGVLV